VSRALRELTGGYRTRPEDVIADAVFEQDYDEMVVVKDIPFYSLCEHHMLPFFGSCHVGYLPKGRVIGLSKIPRLIDVFAHRLQVQEKMTKEIAEALNAAVDPRGVGIVVEARHLCMEMRGVQKPGGHMMTSCMLGTFRKDPRTRAEFLALVKRPS
jgi:GTP cyclohydrolase I